MYGFNTAGTFHKSCIQSFGGIWFSQEHWLSTQNLTRLQSLDAQYVARSGMEDAVSAGVLRGRPFGGVSIAWSKDLNHLIFPLTNYKHKRVVAAEMRLADEKILLINVYMPFLDTRNRAASIVETTDAISMLDLIVHDHPLHDVIIGGDLNSELTDNSPFDPLWREFSTKNRLAYCSQFLPASSYSFHQETLGHKKLLDHFIVSQRLISDDRVGNIRILEDGDNTSDHLPITMSLKARFQPGVDEQITATAAEVLRWSKVSARDRGRFGDVLSASLARCEPLLSNAECNAECHCEQADCRDSLQEAYDDIVGQLKVADQILPRSTQGHQKEWWTAELSELKQQSIDIEELWISHGRPGSGPTHQERLRVRAAYRKAIRAAQRAPKQAKWNRLHAAMENNETSDFWKSWRTLYNKNKSPFAPVVDGCSSKEGIASAFKNSFQKNSEPNNGEKVAELNAQFEFEYREFSESHSSSCNCSHYSISNHNVFDALFSLKRGKCADDEGLSAEHLQFSPASLIDRLTALFNSMLKHSFVPWQFRSGFMIPLVKDNQGDLSDVSNYRGITISPIISKLFEHVLKVVFGDFLSSSAYQFGFKKKSSTVHSLHCFKETVNYYVNNGSRVFGSLLDASKAFDRLVHSGLFIKLMKRKVPKIFLDILITWHSGLRCRVKWDGCFSDWFSITAGVRQGGVLSPNLYSIYVDDLIYILKSAGIGCYIRSYFAAALFYADDVALLAPSLKGLQRLLNICQTYCEKWDICLNPKKTKNLFFGNLSAPSHEVKINGNRIPWVDKAVYLGLMLKSGRKFECCAKEKVSKFYRSLNSILRIEGRSDDLVMLRLLETHCVPILTYGIEVLHVRDPDERRQLRVAYNSVFRKIFGYTRRESVTELQHALNRPTWEELTERRKLKFRSIQTYLSLNPLVRAFGS